MPASPALPNIPQPSVSTALPTPHITDAKNGRISQIRYGMAAAPAGNSANKPDLSFIKVDEDKRKEGFTGRVRDNSTIAFSIRDAKGGIEITSGDKEFSFKLPKSLKTEANQDGVIQLRIEFDDAKIAKEVTFSTFDTVANQEKSQTVILSELEDTNQTIFEASPDQQVKSAGAFLAEQLAAPGASVVRYASDRASEGYSSDSRSVVTEILESEAATEMKKSGFDADKPSEAFVKACEGLDTVKRSALNELQALETVSDADIEAFVNEINNINGKPATTYSPEFKALCNTAFQTDGVDAANNDVSKQIIQSAQLITALGEAENPTELFKGRGDKEPKVLFREGLITRAIKNLDNTKLSSTFKSLVKTLYRPAAMINALKGLSSPNNWRASHTFWIGEKTSLSSDQVGKSIEFPKGRLQPSAVIETVSTDTAGNLTLDPALKAGAPKPQYVLIEMLRGELDYTTGKDATEKTGLENQLNKLLSAHVGSLSQADFDLVTTYIEGMSKPENQARVAEDLEGDTTDRRNRSLIEDKNDAGKVILATQERLQQIVDGSGRVVTVVEEGGKIEEGKPGVEEVGKDGKPSTEVPANDEIDGIIELEVEEEKKEKAPTHSKSADKALEIDSERVETLLNRFLKASPNQLRSSLKAKAADKDSLRPSEREALTVFYSKLLQTKKLTDKQLVQLKLMNRHFPELAISAIENPRFDEETDATDSKLTKQFAMVKRLFISPISRKLKHANLNISSLSSANTDDLKSKRLGDKLTIQTSFFEMWRDTPSLIKLAISIANDYQNSSDNDTSRSDNTDVKTLKNLSLAMNYHANNTALELATSKALDLIKYRGIIPFRRPEFPDSQILNDSLKQIQKDYTKAIKTNLAILNETGIERSEAPKFHTNRLKESIKNTLNDKFGKMKSASDGLNNALKTIDRAIEIPKRSSKKAVSKS